jgi:hypothetical protein
MALHPVHQTNHLPPRFRPALFQRPAPAISHPDQDHRDDFIAAQEILTTQINDLKNEYLKDKLGLEKDVIISKEPDEDDYENNEEE